jgi:hypothetical protein
VISNFKSVIMGPFVLSHAASVHCSCKFSFEQEMMGRNDSVAANVGLCTVDLVHGRRSAEPFVPKKEVRPCRGLASLHRGERKFKVR